MRGRGKSNTTAAMGAALQTAGQGMRVLMLDFRQGSWLYGGLDGFQASGDKFPTKQMSLDEIHSAISFGMLDPVKVDQL